MSLATSCSVIYDTPGEGPEAAGSLLSVTFAVPQDGRDGSASDEGHKWGDIYNSMSGTSFDSYIVPDMLRLAVFDTGGKYKGEIDKIFFGTLPSESGEQRYNFLGQLPDGLSEKTTYRIMAFANAPGYVSADSYPTTDGNFGIGQIQPDKGSVPMWGVASGEFKIGRQTQFAEELTLLRSVAKTYVSLDYKSYNDGFRISSITLSLPVDKGNIVPDGWSSVGNTKEIFFRHITDNVYAPASNPVTSGTAVSQAFYKSDDNGWIIYSPEYDNSRGDAVIDFTLTRNGEEYKIEGTPFRLFYRDYSAEDERYFDIARNHIYTFVIGLKTDDGLRFEVTVDDMQKGGDYVFDY